MKPVLLGHRGCAHAPGNTLVAFEHALADGADGIECDVRTTRDGTLVLAHDEEIDGRRIDAMTFAETRACTLAEALDLIRSRGAIINVEVKQARARDVLAAIRRAGILDGVILSSFDHGWIVNAKAMEPRITASALLDEPTRVPGVDILAPADRLATPEFIRSCGARVHVWTVNDPARAKELAALGVEGIITDYPNRLRSALL